MLTHLSVQAESRLEREKSVVQPYEPDSNTLKLMDAPVARYDCHSSKHQIVESVLSRYQVQQGLPFTTERTYYDTFDWRLYRKKLYLAESSQGGQASLTFGDLKHRVRHHFQDAQVPDSGVKIEQGPLKDALGPVLGVRRPLSLVKVCSRVEAYLLRDAGGVVARLELEMRVSSLPGSSGQEVPIPSLLTVSSENGCSQEYGLLVELMESSLRLQKPKKSELQVALEAIGRVPGKTNTVDSVRLKDPGEPAFQAVRRLLQANHRVMVANQTGVIRQLDPEFLHDFRVSVRRTRSLMARVAKVFPRHLLVDYKPQFSWLGKLTNRARDLDVFREHVLAELELGENFENEWDLLLQITDQLRVLEQDRIVEALTSVRYQNLRHGWERTLEANDPNAWGPAAQSGIRKVASAEILSAYQKLLDQIEKTDPTVPKQIHRVRIQGKKLRYLMQFFAGLYRRGRTQSVLSQLSRFHKTLGKFNDCDVYEQTLLEATRHLVENSGATARTLMELGRIQERIRIRREDLQNLIGQNLRRWGRKKMRRRFEKIFS